MRRHAWSLSLAALLLVGCSVKKYAIHQVGKSLARGSGATFGAEDDPELIRGAGPFTLKLIETLLGETPKDDGLLISATRGFAQYSYAFVQMDADEAEDKDRVVASALRTRAKKLYLRARDYGMRGLELKHPNFGQQLKDDPAEAVKALKKSEVPFAYWTGLSWAAALVVSKDMFMLPETPRFEALMQRVLELDESFEMGTVHTFFIAYEMVRMSGAAPDRAAKAKEHFDRAVELSGGKLAGPYVAYAEGVLEAKKDKENFVKVLNQALKIDVNAAPESRVINLITQRRAKWLLARVDRLFPK